MNFVPRPCTLVQRLALSFALVALAIQLANAQARKPATGTPGQEKQDQSQEAQQPERPPPPYEKRLLRLAHIMGALSYLQPLCAGGEGQVSQNWRAAMRKLLDAEAKTQNQRARLAGAFNAGFRGYEATYRVCTDNARLVIARFLTEGEKIAQDVANRFGGG